MLTRATYVLRINIPFKDQVSANSVQRQLRDLSNKIGLALQPVFVSKQLEQELKPSEAKPSIFNQPYIVYHFVCDLCDADYVGYTARHLLQCVPEHKNSATRNNIFLSLFETGVLYQFLYLPMELTSSPRILTKVLKPVFAHLRGHCSISCAGYWQLVIYWRHL